MCIAINKNILVYMHNYTCPKSCIPKLFSHVVASWMNYWISFDTPFADVLWISYPGISAAAVFTPRAVSALVPGIKNDRSLSYERKYMWMLFVFFFFFVMCDQVWKVLGSCQEVLRVRCKMFSIICDELNSYLFYVWWDLYCFYMS